MYFPKKTWNMENYVVKILNLESKHFKTNSCRIKYTLIQFSEQICICQKFRALVISINIVRDDCVIGVLAVCRTSDISKEDNITEVRKN